MNRPVSLARLPITDALISEGPAYVFMTEDGPSTTWDLAVVVTAGGKEYAHPHTFWRTRPLAAERLLAQVLRAGSIDPALWTELDPPTSLEDRWDAMAQHEAEERMGCRAPHDMYHGIPLR